MSGERESDRRTIDKLTKDQIDSGIKPKTAEEKAKKAMREADRRLRDSGKR